MKHIALQITTAAVLLFATASCRTYNTYVEVPAPKPTPAKPAPRPAPAPSKSAAVSGGSSPEGFQAVTRPSSYSN